MGVFIKADNVTFQQTLKSGNLEDYAIGNFNLGVDEASTINNLGSGQDLTVFDDGGLVYDANSVKIDNTTSGPLNFFRFTYTESLRKFTIAARVDSDAVNEHIFVNSAAVTTVSRGGGIIRASSNVIGFSVLTASGTEETLATPAVTPSYPYSVVGTIFDDGSQTILSLYVKADSESVIEKYQKVISDTLAHGWDTPLIDIGRDQISGGTTDLSKVIMFNNAASDREAETLIDFLNS